MTGPLADITILDFTHMVCGPYATKLLADFGANVIKVESIGGEPGRWLVPFQGDSPDPERSGSFAYLNTNKRSITIDLKHPSAASVVERLCARADVVVESFSPGTLDRLGIGWEFIHRARPSAPLISISNFGATGPYRDYQGTELTLFGFGGEMYTMGIAGREPVKMYGTAALVQSGAAAATAIMAAGMVGIGQGIGQHVDFSIVDSHLLGNDRRHATAIAHEFSGKKSFRSGGTGIAAAEGTYPCADGWVEFTAASQRLDRLADMLGNPEWFQGPHWKAPGALLSPDLVEEFNGHFYGWLAERTKREVWAEARRAKVLCGPLMTVEDLCTDEHFVPRGFLQQVDHPRMGQFTMPGRPFSMPASPWELRLPAPLIGEHTESVLADCGYSADEIGRLDTDGVVGVRR